MVFPSFLFDPVFAMSRIQSELLSWARKVTMSLVTKARPGLLSGIRDSIPSVWEGAWRRLGRRKAMVGSSDQDDGQLVFGEPEIVVGKTMIGGDFCPNNLHFTPS